MGEKRGRVEEFGSFGVSLGFRGVVLIFIYLFEL